MAWEITFRPKAAKELKKLDKQAQKQIIKYIKEVLQPSEDPRSIGTMLKGDYGEMWRFRSGDYRLIGQIHDEIITIEILKVGHHKNVYKRLQSINRVGGYSGNSFINITSFYNN